jgi:hypothetical protein
MSITEKLCRRCDTVKPITGFSLSRKATATQKAVLRSDCKECCSARARKWFADNPERANDNRRRWNLRDAYDLTPQQYIDILRAQGGVCAICGKSESGIVRRGHASAVRMSVDHCHDSGRVRGLLCNRCNRAVGLFGDDPIVLRRAISYLLKAKRT